MARRHPKREHEAILVRQEDGETWEPDVCLQVHVSKAWRVTEHPVEDGVVVSDHVQQQPDQVTMECILTENPTSTGGVTGGLVHLQDRIKWLQDTADAGQLVDIVMRRMGTFTGYAIQSVPYTLDRVSRLQFALELREVRIATATDVTVTVTNASNDVATGAPDEVDAGEQATTSTDTDEQAEEADQSLLSSLLAAF